MEAKLRALVAQWLHQAKLIEQAAVCAGCPIGGAAHALRECAREANEALGGER